MQQLDDSIARYMTELDRAHREPALVTDARVEHIKEKMQTVKQQMRQLKKIGKQMSQTPDGQISLTDPDARSMATSGRGTGMVGYNVQTAVDTKHHMPRDPCRCRPTCAVRGPRTRSEARIFLPRRTFLPVGLRVVTGV
jgi:hypothetical protein